jgi:hypothetical protein
MFTISSQVTRMLHWFRALVSAFKPLRAGVLAILAISTLGPVAVVTYRPYSSLYLFMGAAAWVIAVGVKRQGLGLIAKAGSWKRLSREWRGVSVGMWSGFTELGLTLLFFLVLLRWLDFFRVLVFGFGVATAEALFLIWIGYLHRSRSLQPPEASVEPGTQSFVVRNMFLIERVLATGIHILSRTLIYESITVSSLLLGLFSFRVFSVVDGVAHYGHLSKWNWLLPKTARSYYGLIFALIVFQTVVAVLFYCKLLEFR